MPPPMSSAVPIAIGPAVVRGVADICGPVIVAGGPTAMNPVGASQRPSATRTAAMMARVIRIFVGDLAPAAAGVSRRAERGHRERERRRHQHNRKDEPSGAEGQRRNDEIARRGEGEE